MTSPAQDLVEVRLVQLPVQVWAAAQEHFDGLLREFALMTAEQGAESLGGLGVPARLLELVGRLQQQYAGTSDVQRAALFAAAEAGRTTLDLTYRVPRSAAGACQHLDAMLDEADEYCRAGQHLLTLAAPPDQVAFRKWYLSEFVAQIRGAEPVPWRYRSGTPSPTGPPSTSG
ncbi:MAG: hypothetical protein M3P93_15735 [Actinomycetota bacterium]|nr:hypothetical protein [Actinomycetota bacterium]